MDVYLCITQPLAERVGNIARALGTRNANLTVAHAPGALDNVWFVTVEAYRSNQLVTARYVIDDETGDIIERPNPNPFRV